MKKLRAILLASFAVSILFCVFSLSFHADISALSFPVTLFYTFAAFYASYIVFYRQDKPLLIPTVRKLFQYEPFVFLATFVLRRAGAVGTQHWYDVCAVSTWCAAFVLSLIILRFIDPKRVSLLSDSCALFAQESAKRRLKGVHFVLHEVFDWVDAVIQAVCMVLLIQIFIVQLYQIPSESMVPQFMINDRVIVFKTASGPKFPLSDIGIPAMKKYKRGDIVVFRNPHYQIDRKSEIKTFVSQLVYMLTLTKVNLNVDEFGETKADPLVKRVTGVSGEQLMMQDGVLYARKKGDESFSPVTEEWAAWDLNALSVNDKDMVRDIPVSGDEVRLMIECEKKRRELDIDAAATECKNISNEFKTLFKNSDVLEADFDGLFSPTDMFEFELFNKNVQLTTKLLTAEGGAAWFNAFMTDWTKSREAVLGKFAFQSDLYSEANYKLNLMIKLAVGHLVIRNAQLLLNRTPPSQADSDKERLKYIEDAVMLHNYIMLQDRRNMPIFPANDASGYPSYIPDDCYFMMGDNRFNSLDMRHSYTSTLKRLSPYDTYSVTYYSNMAPQYVSRRWILGATAFRFWPLNRISAL